MNQAHGNTQRRLQVSAEIVTDGGKAPDRLGRGRAPGMGSMVQFGLRNRGTPLGDRKEAQVRVGTGGDIRCRLKTGRQGPLHIGLSRTNPNLADNHIAQNNSIVAADLKVAPLGGGLQRLETHRPTTILGHSGDALTRELHGHRLTVGRTPPDRHRPALLQNCMIGKERMERHVGPNKA